MYKGLSSEEVEKRIEKGQVNEDNSVKTKSYGRIICDNLFTLFNLLNLISSKDILGVRLNLTNSKSFFI